MTEKSGILYIIVGPAGVGKTVLIKELIRRIPSLARVATATSRPMRTGEVHGRDYYFFSPEEFASHIENKDFIEWVWFAGYQYGTLREPIVNNLQSGRSQIMSIDIHGAAVFRKEFPSLVSIFILPPAFEALEKRMLARGQNTPEQIAEKLKIAKEEITHQREFDYVVVNDDLAKAVNEIVKIIEKKQA